MKSYKIPEGQTIRLIVVSSKNFAPVFGKASDFQLEFQKSDRPQSLVKDKPALVYIDLALWEDEESAVKAVSSVLKKDMARVGIIDSRGISKDPALYFRMGCVDFLLQPVLSEGIKATRYRQVLGMSPFRAEDFDAVAPKQKNLYSGGGWKDIHQGREYIFGFMFVELDDIPELRDSLGNAVCRRLSVDLRDYLSEYISVWDGYVWIWSDFGGVILFPFDGSCYHALEAGMELVINQEYINFSDIDREATFRVSLHLGQTKFYSRGKTGDIVSDSVNSLFHLGHHFTDPASLHLTEDVRPFIPRSLESYFVSRGKFEGREIFKIRDRV